MKTKCQKKRSYYLSGLALIKVGPQLLFLSRSFLPEFHTPFLLSEILLPSAHRFYYRQIVTINGRPEESGRRDLIKIGPQLLLLCRSSLTRISNTVFAFGECYPAFEWENSACHGTPPSFLFFTLKSRLLANTFKVLTLMQRHFFVMNTLFREEGKVSV